VTVKEEDMAEKKPAEQAAPEQQAAPTAPSTGEVFTVDRLVEDAVDLTGYQPHEVAGAVASTGKSEMTAEEARNATHAWLASPVEEV
jgi:hypothetical protein